MLWLVWLKMDCTSTSLLYNDLNMRHRLDILIYGDLKQPCGATVRHRH